MDKRRQDGTGLETHVAATLAYLGGWVSGLILLLLETNNRVVRFHAMQSIITFGSLQLLMALLIGAGSLSSLAFWHGAALPVSLIFTISWLLVLALSIALWLLLMLHSYRKEHILLPLAGDLAFWLLPRLGMETPEREAMAFRGLRSELPRADKRSQQRVHGSAIGRTAGSIAAIVWNVFLFIVFNFFADYIAFYHDASQGGVSQLLRYPILTAELSRVLPILNLAIVVGLLGYLIVLTWNRYLVKEVVELVVHVMWLGVSIVTMRVFPFDFSYLPLGSVTAALPTVTMILLILAIVGNIIEIVVHLLRLSTGLYVR